MTGVYGRLALLTVLLLLGANEVGAQGWIGNSGPRRGAVEITGGGIWNGSQDVDEGAAVLTGSPGSGSGSFQLFNSEPTLKQVIGAQALIGFYVTRTFAIEGGVQFSRPTLSVRLGDDFEDAPDVTATTTITQYLFTGSAVYHFGKPGRVAPFVAVGAGQLRDVHSSNQLIETSVEYHGTFGVKYWTGNGRRRLGIRAEGGLSMRTGAFNFGEERRTVPTAAVSLAYLY